jgi:cytochrome c oxidase subunit 2
MRTTLLFLVSAAAYGQPQSVMAPASPIAGDIAGLGRFVLVVFVVVMLVMWGLIVWVAIRKRGTLEEHAPVGVGGGQRAVFWGGFAIPTAILAVIFVLNLRVMQAVVPGPMDAMAAPDIRLVGHQWWWELQYKMGGPQEHFRTANEIHIPTGRKVVIELDSADVIHSFWVPRLQGKADLIPGRTNRITLYTDTPGEYAGECAEYCGAQHAHMRLLVIAQPMEDFVLWMHHQAQPAEVPTDDAGEQVFASGPCGLCHEIRGTSFHGSVGPDLTHLAGRRMLAANSLPRNEATLRAWITHAQSLKPGVRMPNVTQFSGEELAALSGFLGRLE